MMVAYITIRLFLGPLKVGIYFLDPPRGLGQGGDSKSPKSSRLHQTTWSALSELQDSCRNQLQGLGFIWGLYSG